MSRAYICDVARTPIGRYGGALAGVRADDLAAIPIRVLIERHPALAEAVDDVYYGSTNQAGEDNRNVARMALLLAGLSESTPGVTVNRLCGSGLEAVVQAARQIGAGEADVVIAGGVESMSRAPFVMVKSEGAYPTTAPEVASTTLGWRLVNPRMAALGHTDALGITAENVAEEHGISRDDQDAFALRSQQRATRAAADGRLAAEITPVTIEGRQGTVVVDADEHPRPDTTLETLGKLGGAFRKGGTVTAGNSSGINDASGALLVASEAAVSKYGLTPLAVVGAANSVGVAPRVMGIGPVPATRKLLARTGLTIADIDIVEINEAFASQSLACLRALGLPDDGEHVNPHGGAIALGHPTGMSGARLAGTAAIELSRRGGRRALVTMCIGVGQGIAVLLEAP